MAEENESETDYGSSPFKTVPDADKQILEWTSRLELETVHLRDTSESLFKIIKENVDELSSSRKLFQAELESRKGMDCAAAIKLG
ncbi:unnamed protein product [Kluyveromyces dobzhanskii CBS 2104]|uniref:WGS project CCBQ000000000 data, contig 00046 n=1 Tax=Kluyveromyces dobzhanskii CBS 2104 TaxID=1427455 RepID=A0A0A8L9N5_9SACH|nr:unnamed protein product [Kluyveromyces dobzhanskii CBS 2104]